MSAPGDRGYRIRRRIQFHETDLAGVVHFSWFFRYMEEAEHALWQAAGLTADRAGSATGWPRVSASFDFRNPLHFEDEVEIEVRIQAVTRRTIQYRFVMTCGETPIGAGALTAAYARRRPGEPMQATDLPPEVVARLRAVTGQTGEAPGRILADQPRK
jgi:acyl-CoA thioester hydrolase